MKDFYYIEKPDGHNEYMLFGKFSNMPRTAYHGTKGEMEKIKDVLNVKINEVWKEHGKPEMHFQHSTPKQFRTF